ncbi:hypothetical protein BYT27DRAFT_7106830 [Phlegmacium glaucopus]|nr:hypothetical protein BYT27DRAFT_7106830 [Phlegmacium glaucopus]
MLQKVSLGDEWAHLVCLWAAFEVAAAVRGRKNKGIKLNSKVVIFDSPVRSGYWVPRGSNRDRDQLAFVPEPKIT